MPSDSLARTRLTTSEHSADPAPQIAREALSLLFGPPAARGFAVRLWDGSTDSPSGSPRFTLILRRPGALRRMVLPPTQRRIGEAYVRNAIDVEGDLEAAASLVESIARRAQRPGTALRLLRLLARLPADGARREPGRVPRTPRRIGVRHTRRRDAAAIRHHYDVSNEFYGLWLDRRLVYSCGYFTHENATLDAAQEAKLDLICRKLRLRPGQRFLDIGCGWGALALHAAERYGVDATGITLSREQAALARARIAAAGLTERCRVELCDYRDLQTTAFDRIASVGMVEHVGRALLPTYFRHAFRMLAPGGLFLNHGIVASGAPVRPLTRWLARRTRRWTSFIDAHVFPDGELVSPADMLAPAVHAGFEVRDVENLREHYACTLRHWVRRLEACHDDVVPLVGEATYRVWRAYMAGSAHAFASGQLGVIQTLLAKRDAAGGVPLPCTRADLYA